MVVRQVQVAGWGWFSDHREISWPHTTALVVHGLQLASENDVKLPPNMLEPGVAWLKSYQDDQVRQVHNGPAKMKPYRETADNIDAMVYMTLVGAGVENTDMRHFRYRDHTQISVYAKAMFGLALQKQVQKDKLAMIMTNIVQYVVWDDENQTAYLKIARQQPLVVRARQGDRLPRLEPLRGDANLGQRPAASKGSAGECAPPVVGERARRRAGPGTSHGDGNRR